MMRKLFTLAALLMVFSAMASAQNIEKLFNKYQDDERFQYIYQKKAGQFEAIEDFIDGYVERSSMTSNGKKMLVLSDDKKSFADSFTQEVMQAINADKYENTSLVRAGKNRVEKYQLQTPKGSEIISFIRNPGNITLIWYSYVKKSGDK